MTSMHTYVLAGRPLWFPWLSGTLRYTCAGCPAPCCKQTPLTIGKSRELATIQQAQPHAQLFAVPTSRGSQMLALAPPLEQCWFLDKHTRCRLEHVLGREAKPAGCRLFPFAKLRSLGETLAVLPDFVCPIETGPVEHSGPFSHDELALEMHRTQVPRSGHQELKAPRDLAWRDAVPLERRIVEESELFMGSPTYTPFLELQHQLALASLGVDGRRQSAARVEDVARRFMGITEQPTPLLVHDMVLLTGVLRLELSALPRRETAPMLACLLVLLSAAEHMRGAVRTPRTITSLLESHAPLLYVLAHLSDRPTVRASVSLKRAVGELPAVRAPLVALLEDIADNGRRTVAASLEDLLRRQGDTFARPLTADAIAMLHSLGKVLLRAGAFVPV